MKELTEKQIHLTVMRWVRLQKDLDRFVLHFPNESPRHPRYGLLLKNMGMRKGVSDLFIAKPCGGYHGAWIEIKTNKGRVSKEQKEFHEDMESQNYFCAVTRGVDDTINTIECYIKNLFD